jgi:hypothetical protein
MPILQALTGTDYKNKITSGHMQLNLFNAVLYKAQVSERFDRICQTALL